MAPPSEKTVDQRDSSNDTKQRGNNGSTDLETEPGSVGEGVQGILSLVLVVVGDDDSSSGEGFLSLGISHLGDGQRGGDGHDAGRHQRLGIETETDISNQDGTGDGSETTSHNLMELGLGHVRNKRSDQHGRFTLSDKRRGSSDDGLGTRHTERPEDKGRKLLDEPLEEANVVQDLDQGDEEDDGRDDTEEEHGQLRNVGVGQEGDTILGKAQEILGARGDESEDVVTDARSEHKETDDVLRKHTSNDGSPIDALAILARQPQDEEEDGKTEQADGAVLTGIVLDLLRDERADENDSNGQGCASERSELFRDAVIDDKRRVLPDPADRARDISDGDVEEEQTQRDGEPEEEGNDPVLVIAV